MAFDTEAHRGGHALRLIDMGVDGIISDRPDLLRQVAAEKGIALPRPFPVSP